MGDVTQHRPVLAVLAAFSRHDAALAWARQRAAETWSPVALASDVFEFSETQFYERTMGPNLRKTFWAFERLVDPTWLVDAKHQTNSWEQQYTAANEHDEPRPLNLDPGYISEAKLVLATTKDRDHRLYLDRGIFAEVTLHFHRGQWRSREWTYPDYQRDDYHLFFVRCRDYLRGRYREA